MVTGKPEAFQGVLALSRNPESAQRTTDLRFAFNSGWRLADGCPQPAAASTRVPDGYARKTRGARIAIWRQKNLPERASTTKNRSLKHAPGTKLIGHYKACKNRVRFVLRGVNSMDKPNGRLVLVSFTCCHAFTPSLSTRSSSWALQGDLILGRASRLYAFSGYHNRTSLPSRALGRTTGTQEVRPSRSSRTKDSPPQISYAHSR